MLAPAAAYYFAEVIRGAHEAAARLGARLILRVTDYRPEDDAAHAAGLLAAGAQGLLLAPSWTEPEHPERYGEWIARLPGEKVLVERRGAPGSPLEGLDQVGSDHAHGVLLAVRHLVRLGHGTPMLVARSDSPTALAVRTGFTRALAALGLAGTEPLIATVSADRDPALFERSAQAVRSAVREGRASSVLVHNDEEAIRLVQPAGRAGGAGPRGPGADHVRRRGRGARRHPAERGGPAQAGGGARCGGAAGGAAGRAPVSGRGRAFAPAAGGAARRRCGCGSPAGGRGRATPTALRRSDPLHPFLNRSLFDHSIFRS